MTQPSESAHFELSFSPNVSLVSTVRRFVSEFYVQILSDAEATSQLAVATHELLDNAVLYSDDGNTAIRIVVHREPDAFRVGIETRNRATPANVEAVRTAIDEMNAAPDAAAHYQVLMRRSAKRADASGLGLARVRAEADMTLTCEIEGGTVCLRAGARYARVGGK
jgi:anti-sigma regulatory factor (Ser/Thr protein kinase)